MKKKSVPVFFVAAIIIISIVVLVVGNIIDKRTPSKKHASEEDLYKLYRLYDGYTEDGDKISFEGATKAADNQVAILLQNELVSNRAFIDNGELYVDYEFVKNSLNNRFYWDNNENILIYTTPTDIVKASVGSQEYYVTKAKKTAEYTIVKTEGSKVYVALDFVKNYSNIEYTLYESPNRVCITNGWGTEENIATLKKDTKIRLDKSIKSDILYNCKTATEVVILDKGKTWSEVITEDGFFGYVKTDSLGKQTTKTLQNDYVEPEYTNIQKDFTINLAWHMVTAQASNNQLMDLVTPAKGLNNITAIIDRNMLQIDGDVEKVKALEPLADKLRAFNWNVVEIDGHDINQVYDALYSAKNNRGDKPVAIIAHTVKGKGVSFMENQASWHGKAPSDEEAEKALAELV